MALGTEGVIGPVVGLFHDLAAGAPTAQATALERLTAGLGRIERGGATGVPIREAIQRKGGEACPSIKVTRSVAPRNWRGMRTRDSLFESSARKQKAAIGR